MSAAKPALWKQVRIRQTDEGGEMKISFQRATRLPPVHPPKSLHRRTCLRALGITIAQKVLSGGTYCTHTMPS